jgi:PAS domain S-box-containing protein
VNVSQPLVQAGLLGEAIDRGPAVVLVADEELNHVAVNQRACDVLGYTREELLVLAVGEVSPDEEIAGLHATPSAAGKMRLRRKDGSEFEADFRATRTTVAGMPLFVAVAFVAA